jgi:hypothetical protein
LDLYIYESPRNGWNRNAFVKSVDTDDRGYFDFGELAPYHYTLRVADIDSFDVEVKDALPRATDSVFIDVSPVEPDCSDGHEFVVRQK